MVADNIHPRLFAMLGSVKMKEWANPNGRRFLGADRSNEEKRMSLRFPFATLPA